MLERFPEQLWIQEWEIGGLAFSRSPFPVVYGLASRPSQGKLKMAAVKLMPGRHTRRMLSTPS